MLHLLGALAVSQLVPGPRGEPGACTIKTKADCAGEDLAGGPIGGLNDAVIIVNPDPHRTDRPSPICWALATTFVPSSADRCVAAAVLLGIGRVLCCMPPPGWVSGIQLARCDPVTPAQLLPQVRLRQPGPRPRRCRRGVERLVSAVRSRPVSTMPHAPLRPHPLVVHRRFSHPPSQRWRRPCPFILFRERGVDGTIAWACPPLPPATSSQQP